VSEEHEVNHTKYFETTIENAHFNVYREHMMGQPKKGDRDNVHSLSLSDIQQFHSANYFGDHIVVTAVGNVDHEQIVQ
jgi:processing peptidase subunit beta